MNERIQYDHMERSWQEHWDYQRASINPQGMMSSQYNQMYNQSHDRQHQVHYETTNQYHQLDTWCQPWQLSPHNECDRSAATAYPYEIIPTTTNYYNTRYEHKQVDPSTENSRSRREIIEIATSPRSFTNATHNGNSQLAKLYEEEQEIPRRIERQYSQHSLLHVLNPVSNCLKPLKKKKPKKCNEANCTKYAASNGKCIAHGGGRRCKVPDCPRGVKNYGLCWAHGGRRMCIYPGCKQGGKIGQLCWAHGGGKKCSVKDCTKGALKGALCWAHGGGKRCAEAKCKRHPQTGDYCNFHLEARNK